MADARPFHWEFRPDPVAREVFRVEGGRPLSGTVQISGAKNAALKLFAAAVLTGERCRLTNVPEIEDVRVMAETLADLGVVVDHPGHGVYEIAAGDVDWLFVPLEAAAKMRASFILFGPLLARFGHVIISNPGGDRIGRRPVTSTSTPCGRWAPRSSTATAIPGQGAGAPPRGRRDLPHRLRHGTENAMLAATLAEGTTDMPPRRPRNRRWTTSWRSSARWARRSSGPLPTRSPSKGGDGSAAREHRWSPTASRPAPRGRRRGRRRADHPGRGPLRVPRLVSSR